MEDLSRGQQPEVELTVSNISSWHFYPNNFLFNDVFACKRAVWKLPRFQLSGKVVLRPLIVMAPVFQQNFKQKAQRIWTKTILWEKLNTLLT